MATKTSFKAEYCELATKFCKLGARTIDLAEALGVSPRTVENWMSKYPKFDAAVREGKKVADANVAKSLYSRAVGYDHDDTHIAVYQGTVIKTALIKHYPPDPVSCIFWLKNRQPDLWKDRMEHTGAGGKDLVPPTDIREVARGLAFILAQATHDEGA